VRAPAGACYRASARAAALGRGCRPLTSALLGVGQRPRARPSSVAAFRLAADHAVAEDAAADPHLPREDTMPEPAAPRPDPAPATTRPRPSPNGTAPPKPLVPPMPSEVTKGHTRPQRPAAAMVRTAISPLRKMMRRAPRHA
jgi:hypothetical protein